MAKPILLIIFPYGYEMMTEEELNSTANHLKNEYHVLAQYSTDVTNTKIEVLSAGNIDPLTIARLQEKLNLNNILYVDDDNLPEPFKSM